MSFVPKEWEDEPHALEVLEGRRKPTSKTPVNAAALIDLEERVAAYVDKALFFNVKAVAFGAKGDGVTNDAVAIQAAIDAANAAGGGIVFFPGGTYIIGTALKIYSKILLRGAGEQVTTIKVKNAANIDAIVGNEFATLTGTNSLGGIHDFEVGDLTIDGNRSNQTTGSGVGLKVYGYRYRLHNLRVKETRGDGIYSEWSKEPNLGAVSDRDIEAFVINVRAYGARGRCIAWLGPHDSQFLNIFTVATEETTRGLSFEGNGYTNQVVNLHSWGKFTEYGLYCGPGSGAQYIANAQLEGGTKAQAFVGDAKCVIMGGEIFDGGYGVEAIGIEIGAEGFAAYIDTYFNQTDVAVKFTGNGAHSVIRAIVDSTEGNVVTGTPDTTVRLELVATGGVKDNRPAPSIASAAELVIPPTLDYVSVSGTTIVEKVKGTHAGHVVTLRFTSTAKVKDTFPLNLQGEFAPTNGGATLTISYDGEEWNEVARSLTTEAFQELSSAATISPKGGISVLKLTGAIEVTKINATYAGHAITVLFSSTASIKRGNNIKTNVEKITGSGNMTVQFICDGTNWIQVGPAQANS